MMLAFILFEVFSTAREMSWDVKGKRQNPGEASFKMVNSGVCNFFLTYFGWYAELSLDLYKFSCSHIKNFWSFCLPSSSVFPITSHLVSCPVYGLQGCARDINLLLFSSLGVI